MKIKVVVETALYVDDLQTAEAFYRTVLGLPVIGKEPSRFLPGGRGRRPARSPGRSHAEGCPANGNE
jgi:catechol 2,3-dioxygenase-like lactoylglutathione lyase family enzyme